MGMGMGPRGGGARATGLGPMDNGSKEVRGIS